MQHMNNSMEERKDCTKDRRKRKAIEYYKFFQLLLMSILLILLNTCAWVAEKKVHGEECLGPEQCNEKDLLSCGPNGECICSPTHSLLWDKEIEKCVGRVGQKCGSALRGDLALPLLCVEGAICDESSGGCVCTDDFFRVINGTCLRKRKYNEGCVSDNECSKDILNSRPLICLAGVCSCDPAFQFYDEERKQCLTLVGMNCSNELAKYRNECPQNALCIEGSCTCTSGFAATSDGKCGLGHGSTCKSGGECSDVYYQCLDGICTCKYPLHQQFDSKSGQCLSLVGGPCSLNGFSTIGKRHFQACTKNAVCTDLGFYSSCECMEGFVQRSHNGECAPGYGESCEPRECDPITPLYCKNGRCDCRDELEFYDPSRRRCLGLIGSRCNPQEMNQCVQLGSCIQVGAELEGRCLCDRYAQEIENRTCIYNEQ